MSTLPKASRGFSTAPRGATARPKRYHAGPISKPRGASGFKTSDDNTRTLRATVRSNAFIDTGRSDKFMYRRQVP